MDSLSIRESPTLKEGRHKDIHLTGQSSGWGHSGLSQNSPLQLPLKSETDWRDMTWGVCLLQNSISWLQPHPVASFQTPGIRSISRIKQLRLREFEWLDNFASPGSRWQELNLCLLLLDTVFPQPSTLFRHKYQEIFPLVFSYKKHPPTWQPGTSAGPSGLLTAGGVCTCGWTHECWVLSSTIS